MKILAISDIHSAPEKVYSYLDGNVVDYIIVIGDVTEFGPEDLFIDTLNKFSEYAPVYAIFGNCDPENADSLIDKSEAINIHNRCIKLEDITLVGYGGSNVTPFDTPNEYSEECVYENLSKFSDDLKDDNFTILITHAPAYGTGADVIPSGDHVGSKSIRKIIEQTQPTLNLSGHIHEAIAEDKIGETIVLNPGDVASDNAAMIELKDDDIKNKKVNISKFKL